jgi:transcriptional regulator with XRE-family HTH domain
MSDAPDREPGLLARRLDRLFATAHPPGRGPYTIAEAVAGINQMTGSKVISYNYLYQLRRGTKSQVGHSRLAAIARFFGVPVTYFTDDDATAADIEEQVEVRKIAAALEDQGVRHIAFRAAGLSAESLTAILTVIENARRLEGLPDGGDPPSTPA